MKNLIFYTSILLLFCISCNVQKSTISKTIIDSTLLKVKIDSSFLLEEDTILFDSILKDYSLLKEKIKLLHFDSLNSNINERKSLIKQSIDLKKKLRRGAFINKEYIVVKNISISNKDTLYFYPLKFIISLKGDSVNLKFNPSITIPTSETTNITNINRKITLFAWLKSKYTLYLLGFMLLLFFMFRFIK